MRDLHIPDLTFPMVEFGRQETPWDLRILLYRGAAKTNYKVVFNRIAAGELGGPIAGRIELVRLLHEVITGRLVGGGSRTTAAYQVRHLRSFFAWADAENQSLSTETVATAYGRWCDSLHQRMRTRQVTDTTCFNAAAIVSAVLDSALERTHSLLATTRIRRARCGKRAVGVAADKQNLADTFAFGHLCLDVVNSLQPAAMFGPLPVPIKLRNGSVIEQWLGLKAPKLLKCLQPDYKCRHAREHVLQTRAAKDEDQSLRTRFPLVHLRVYAEMAIFIAQTGINYADARKLQRLQFSYKSSIDGYEIRDYKARRQGSFLFEIFSEYRQHFESYLAWRDVVFRHEATDLLFPFIRQQGALESARFEPHMLKRVCAATGIRFIPAAALRKTRVNWLLRRSRDPDQTAEMAQHTQQTLLNVYEQPSLQVAQIEIIQFWRKRDPRLNGEPMACNAPGVCDGVPVPSLGLPPEAPKPECVHPSGCLFCDHHRDIDSPDYVWSVASMRHLNSIILGKFLPPVNRRADASRSVELTIDVLTAKMKWFRTSNATRKGWVDEAMARINEGEFHPHWSFVIESAQGI